MSKRARAEWDAQRDDGAARNAGTILVIGANSPLRRAVETTLAFGDSRAPLANYNVASCAACDLAALPADLRAAVLIAADAAPPSLACLAARVPTVVVASKTAHGDPLDAIRHGACDWLGEVDVSLLPRVLWRELEAERIRSGVDRAAASLVASCGEGARFDEYCDRLGRAFEAGPTLLFAADRDARITAVGIGGDASAALREVSLVQSEVDAMCGETAAHAAAAERVLGIPASLHRVWTKLAAADGRGGVQLVARAERPFAAAEVASIEQLAGGAALAVERWRAVAQLRRTDAVKTEFVRTVSHELRTPLNTVIGYADLLVEEAFGPLEEEQRRILRRVGDRARGLLEVIAATLDLPGVAGGRVSLETRPVSVSELLAEIEADTRAWGVRDDLALTWDVASGLPKLITDPGKLRVLLKNLIANALKFTDRGGIAVRARERDGGIELSVEDTGIGIEGEAIHFVFDAFRQANAAATGKYGGVGLGLYIVRRLVSMLGGRLRVESEVGVGSKFRVWLPTAASTHERFDRSR